MVDRVQINCSEYFRRLTLATDDIVGSCVTALNETGHNSRLISKTALGCCSVQLSVAEVAAIHRDGSSRTASAVALSNIVYNPFFHVLQVTHESVEALAKVIEECGRYCSRGADVEKDGKYDEALHSDK